MKLLSKLKNWKKIFQKQKIFKRLVNINSDVLPKKNKQIQLMERRRKLSFQEKMPIVLLQAMIHKTTAEIQLWNSYTMKILICSPLVQITKEGSNILTKITQKLLKTTGQNQPSTQITQGLRITQHKNLTKIGTKESKLLTRQQMK